MMTQTVCGPLLALDLATRTGFAIGAPGEIPRSSAIDLKVRGEERCVALGNLIAFLQKTFSAERPALVVKEAPLALGGFASVRSNQKNVKMTLGLHAIVEAMCMRFGIRLEEAAPATIRRHFIGRANMGERKKTKAAVVQRCHVLGYMPPHIYDEDRADACAIWDFACATYGRRTCHQEKLVMFGEGTQP